MHPRVLEERRQAALNRILGAAQVLAERFGLNAESTAALAVYDRDPDTRQIMRQEATAALLEAILKASQEKKASEQTFPEKVASAEKSLQGAPKLPAPGRRP